MYCIKSNKSYHLLKDCGLLRLSTLAIGELTIVFKYHRSFEYPGIHLNVFPCRRAWELTQEKLENLKNADAIENCAQQDSNIHRPVSRTGEVRPLSKFVLKLARTYHREGRWDPRWREGPSLKLERLARVSLRRRCWEIFHKFYMFGWSGEGHDGLANNRDSQSAGLPLN